MHCWRDCALELVGRADRCWPTIVQLHLTSESEFPRSKQRQAGPRGRFWSAIHVVSAKARRCHQTERERTTRARPVGGAGRGMAAGAVSAGRAGVAVRSRTG
eukprot:10871533-Alexandrium_andersonii.AAC.1